MKSLALVTLFAICSGVLSPANAQDAVWGIDEINRFARAVHAAKTPDDPFETPAPLPVPAREFVIERQIYMPGKAPQSDLGSAGSLNYDPATQTMTFNVNIPSEDRGHMPSVRGLSGQALVIKTGADKVIEDGGVQSNSYGASVRVIKDRSRYWGVGEIIPYSARSRPFGAGRYDSSVKFSLNIAPEEARALSENVILQYVAIPQSGPDNQWLACGFDVESATIRSPVERWTNYCVVLVKYEQIIIIDKRDGSQLHIFNR